jgi:hypothetical protein
MTISVHATGLNDQNHRFAASAANTRGCFRVLRQMNMVPPPSHQSLIPDGREEPPDSSMVEVLWRFYRFQTEVNLDTMALIGSNTIAHDGIAALQISFDDPHQVFAMQCLSMAFHRVQQIVNIDPATVIEPDPDQLGPVPEQEAEEFARSFLVIGAHRSTSLFIAVRRQGKMWARARVCGFVGWPIGIEPPEAPASSPTTNRLHVASVDTQNSAISLAIQTNEQAVSRRQCPWKTLVADRRRDRRSVGRGWTAVVKATRTAGERRLRKSSSTPHMIPAGVHWSISPVHRSRPVQYRHRGQVGPS